LDESEIGTKKKQNGVFLSSENKKEIFCKEFYQKKTRNLEWRK